MYNLGKCIIWENGLNRDLNPGPLAPKARIIPLDHWALKSKSNSRFIKSITCLTKLNTCHNATFNSVHCTLIVKSTIDCIYPENQLQFRLSATLGQVDHHRPRRRPLHQSHRRCWSPDRQLLVRRDHSRQVDCLQVVDNFREQCRVPDPRVHHWPLRR